MRTIIILISLLVFQSCSTLSSSKLYGAIGGALICGTLGAYLGKELSPNRSSESYNQIIGVSSGATICSVGGYYIGKNLFESDPNNIKGADAVPQKKEINIKKPQAVLEDY